MIYFVNGNALKIPLADKSVQCVVTSPPYWGLRDYGISNQLGLEPTPEAYVSNMVAVFREVWRVLRDDGTLWLNLGDSYNGSGGPGSQYDNKSSNSFKGEFKKYDNPNKSCNGLKPKDLVGIPWRVAFALQADGWYLRSDIIWHKPNPMPESVTDRPTKAHEYMFLLTKSARYYYDAEAIREESIGGVHGEVFIPNPGDKASAGGFTSNGKGNTSLGSWNSERAASGRNRRTVWTIATAPYSGAHFATFPPALVEPCILAGTSEKGACPKCGKGWVRVVEKGEVIMPTDSRPGRNYQYKNVTQDDIEYKKSKGGIGSAFAFGSRENITTGWQPACTCDAGDPIPCVVLDPFAGSGTVGMVARKYNRVFVGVELSMEYIHLAENRTSSIQPVMI